MGTPDPPGAAPPVRTPGNTPGNTSGDTSGETSGETTGNTSGETSGETTDDLRLLCLLLVALLLHGAWRLNVQRRGADSPATESSEPSTESSEQSTESSEQPTGRASPQPTERSTEQTPEQAARDAAVHGVTPAVLDINAASADELAALPGVGRVLAARIAGGRAAAPYRCLEELDRVPGVGPSVRTRLAPYVEFPQDAAAGALRPRGGDH